MAVKLDVGHAVFLDPGEGETISDREARNVLILVDDPQLVMTWTRYEAGERGPDPHVHRRHTDAFYIVKGEIEFRLGPGAEHVVRAPAGSAVLAPANVVHTFANESGARAVYLNFHAPNGGFADSLRAMRDNREFEWDSWDPPVDGGRPASDAVVCLPGEGERFERGNRTVTILADTPELSLLELAVTPGWEGVDPHTHDDRLDGFFVLDGEIEFLAGEAPEGTVMAAPLGIQHGVHRPTGNTRLLNFHAPDSGFAGRIRAQQMDAQARYHELADDLAARNDDVTLGKMFGMPCVKRGGKAIAGFWQESVVFKLPDATARERALALDGAAPFDPMGGRPMKEWVVVPAAHADEWLRLAEDALKPSG